MSWPLKKLSDVCDVNMGQAPKGTSYNEDGEGYALIAGAGDYGETTPMPKKYTTEPTKLSQADDLILCIRATIGDLNWSDKIYCLGRGVAGLRPKSGKLDRNYLWHFVQANKEKLSALGTGSTFKQISRKHIEEFRIPLPPLEEQKRIAVILDKADALRRRRKKAIAMTDDLLRSVFLDMFGEVKGNWKKVSFLDVATAEKNSFVNGPFGSNLLTSELHDTGVPVFYIQDVRNGRFERKSNRHVTEAKARELSSCNVKSGDVLIAKVGDPPGAAALYPDGEPDGIVTQDVVRIRPNLVEVTPEFLTGFMNSNMGKNWLKPIIVEATRSRFGLGEIKKKDFFLPPIELQREYSTINKKLSNNRVKLIKGVQNSELLFFSLTQRAFRGELTAQKEAA